MVSITTVATYPNSKFLGWLRKTYYQQFWFWFGWCWSYSHPSHVCTIPEILQQKLQKLTYSLVSPSYASLGLITWDLISEIRCQKTRYCHACLLSYL